MRNLYKSIFAVSIIFFLVMGISSCSENDEDVSAPSITIKRPVENDTIHMSNNRVYIEVKAENNADIDHMILTVITQSGTLLYKYEETQIDKHSYACNKNFTEDDIEVITKVKLIVTVENEYHAWRKKEVNFFLAP